MSYVGCQLRRLGRSFAIAAMGAAGLLMPATAAVSFTQAAPASEAARGAAPAVKGIFAAPHGRNPARSYHAPAADAASPSESVSAAIGFWMLSGLVLMLLAASLAPRRGGCRRGRC
jgi:hypothetical protein